MTSQSSTIFPPFNTIDVHEYEHWSTRCRFNMNMGNHHVAGCDHAVDDHLHARSARICEASFLEVLDKARKVAAAYIRTVLDEIFRDVFLDRLQRTMIHDQPIAFLYDLLRNFMPSFAIALLLMLTRGDR